MGLKKPPKDLKLVQENNSKTIPKKNESPSKLKVASIDSETGGLRPHENTGLISIGLCPPTDSGAKPLVLIIQYNHNLFYDPVALRVNGFNPVKDTTTEKWVWMTKNPTTGEKEFFKGINEKEALDQLFGYIETHLQGAIIAGCNIAFDKAFLEAAAKRVDEKNRWGDFSYRDRLDQLFSRRTLEVQTLALAAHLQGFIKLPDNPKNPGIPKINLETIAKKTLGKGRTSEIHGVLEDALLTQEVAVRIIEKMMGKEKKKDAPTPTHIQTQIS